ncbi:MAG TPA: hypothetical protein VMV41_15935 [Cellulomonadaceae bacterium]|nr:hypothetical protein [Cellulomonadaceae bacterium]
MNPLQTAPRPVPPRRLVVAGRWPRRRVLSGLAAVPVVGAALAAVGGGLPGPVGWTALVGVASVIGAATLASYVPMRGTGRRLDIGCTPCAVVAALTLVGAAGILGGSPHDAASAALAVGLVAFGLLQRMTDPETCPVPPR